MGQNMESVSVYVCTCMCLRTRLRSHFSTNLYEIWQEPLESEKEELIRLGSKSENVFPILTHIRVTILLFLGVLSFFTSNFIFINLCDKLNFVPGFSNINKCVGYMRLILFRLC